MKKIFDYTRTIISLIVTIVLLVISILYGDNKLGGSDVSTLIILPITLVLYILMSYDLFYEAFKHIKKGKIFDEVTLTLIATIAAFAIQEYVEALAVIVFFQIGEMFEDYAVNKSRNSIKSILALRPDTITLYKDGKEEVIEPYKIKIGDPFIVKPGERVPLDGNIIEGNSSFDYSPMTGESIPITKNVGDELLSGVINLTSPIVIKASKEFYNSTVSKILDVVENATNAKTQPEKFISKFARIYTPVVCLLALIFSVVPPLIIGMSDVNVWTTWIRTGASFLVISCPCALVLSVPMAYFVGLGEASKRKIIIKGSHYLELLNKSNEIVFDKTGTITKGNFEVSKIIPANNKTEKELILLANYAEVYSNHPIAKAIKNVASTKIDKNSLSDYKEISGEGVSVLYNNLPLLVGNEKLMVNNHIDYNQDKEIGTKLYVSYNNEFIGLIVIKDTIKDSSREAINLLYQNGFSKTYLLTGDNKEFADEIGKECDISEVYSSLLPLDKTRILTNIINNNKKGATVFVGDGVNDSPSLAIANVGISMGGVGSDAAIESSDVVIMDDDLMRINTAKKISSSTIRIVYQNIIFALGAKFVIMLLTLIDSFHPLGIGNYIMWLAIFADVGVTFICVLNSMRLMLKKFK